LKNTWQFREPPVTDYFGLSKEQLYQAVTFVICVLLFDHMERRRPGFPVARKRELPLNAAAMLFVIFAGELSRKLVTGFYGVFNLGEVLAGTYFRSLPVSVKILSSVVLADFSLYWVHRAMHRRLLWPTHSFHHSIGEIWWLAGARTSFTHLVLFAVPQLFIGYYLFGLTPLQAGWTFSFGVVVNLWIHTNLWVELGPLESVLITPNFHRIHHGASGLTRKNLGFVFTVWDRMFGTYTGTKETGKEFALFPVPTGKRLLRMIVGI
jgi:sterol desaturase/sphingolipid hydroxylase (fatty acid hydroxylase superfamily)